jgi:hypothetical protein
MENYSASLFFPISKASVAMSFPEMSHGVVFGEQD